MKVTISGVYLWYVWAWRREIPALFTPDPAKSSWVNSLWEELSAVIFKGLFEQVRGGLLQ